MPLSQMPAEVCLQIQTSFQPKGHLFTPTGLFSNGNQLLNIRSEIKTQESGKYLNWKQYLKPNSNFIFQFFYNSVLSKSCINGCCCLIFFYMPDTIHCCCCCCCCSHWQLLSTRSTWLPSSALPHSSRKVLKKLQKFSQ